ncbi:MAG: AMP-binding protein [Anaerolineae bacterium]|jgi:acyl-coenzyme A synthetase/AMP-(fatty) acid ligase/thioesterase domain-containing protein/acyl carrier protein|nr:AMP-binding protein [Anaerolineae bacterium]MBT7072317.1 AMP-binding protein [Anaerolineae bacterium]MBT7326037.1 AMP-binding protein [Anaerolineae bacterium]
MSDSFDFNAWDHLDISERLNRIASIAGDTVAVWSKGDALRFHQLDENASLVAGSLQECLPVDSQYPVAILLHQSTSIISTIYGVLRAGHFYCAISAAERQENIARILNDLGRAAIITEEAILDGVKEIIPEECQVLIYSELLANNLSGTLQPKNTDGLAGMFFTSGSTGVPKGVLRSHKDVKYLIRVFHDHLGFKPDDRILAMRPFSTSASMVDIFGGLMNGASLVMYDVRQGGASELASTIKSKKVTIFRPPVQVMRSFIDTLDKGEFFPDLRLFFGTGDVLYKKDVDRIRKLISTDAFVIHQLASSEAGMLAINKIAFDTPLSDEIIPAGNPLAEQEILILDGEGQVIEDNQFGEVAVLGEYLFLGYWKHPEWTDERFIPDPRNPEDNVFLTGDIGRIRTDGQLELRGRKDHRVKVRGYNVNLAAIETVLTKSPKVQRAVVVVSTGVEKYKRLVAYVQPAPGNSPTTTELLGLVSSNLPNYMVPASVMTLADLPVGVTGKIDRKALPPPRWDRPALSVPYVAPDDAIEKKLALIWEKTLRVERIGVYDSFFDLGGDSLLAMHLLLTIEQQFGKKVPFAIIAKVSNIKQQAEVLRADSLGEYASLLVPVQPNGSRKPLYCIGGRGGLPLRFHNIAPYLSEDQPIYFFRSHGFWPGEKPKESKEEAAADYIREIKEIQPEGPYHFMGESGGGLIAYEMALQLIAKGAEVGFLGLLDTKVSMKTRAKNHQPNPIGIIRKHIQTVTGGGVRGIRIYLNYYTELLRFQLFHFRVWMKEKQSHLRYGGLPGVFDRVSKANATASRNYKIKPYPGTVFLFHASRQSRFDRHGPDNGWKDVELGRLVIHSLDCYHANILFEPFVQQVAEKFNEYLDGMSETLP